MRRSTSRVRFAAVSFARSASVRELSLLARYTRPVRTVLPSSVRYPPTSRKLRAPSSRIAAADGGGISGRAGCSPDDPKPADAEFRSLQSKLDCADAIAVPDSAGSIVTAVANATHTARERLRTEAGELMVLLVRRGRSGARLQAFGALRGPNRGTRLRVAVSRWRVRRAG
ncbi:hypothetical protein RHCRD62_60151 [Rhodococcus sp. RD6.2]|nr:hypothetical protein RHCRD62_60151 [Rhodococcus sp. RD6.2]